MSLMTLSLIVIRKSLRIFELGHYFILFLSSSGVVSVETEETHFLSLINKRLQRFCT